MAASSGCATHEHARQVHPLEPNHLFAGEYVDVHAPRDPGWAVSASSASGMSFNKAGEVEGERFSAQVQMFTLPPTASPEEFEALIEKAVKSGSDPTRYAVLDEASAITLERPYPCVRYHVAAKDREVEVQGHPVLLEVEGVYCRHPVRRETGFSVIYSHQGLAPYSELHAEASSFISGVTAPGSGAR